MYVTTATRTGQWSGNTKIVKPQKIRFNNAQIILHTRLATQQLNNHTALFTETQSYHKNVPQRVMQILVYGQPFWSIRMDFANIHTENILLIHLIALTS